MGYKKGKVDQAVQRKPKQVRGLPLKRLTGMRTVLIPAAFSVLTSLCVNHVSQC